MILKSNFLFASNSVEAKKVDIKKKPEEISKEPAVEKPKATEKKVKSKK